MAFSLEIKLGNDLMRDPDHVAEALREAADSVETEGFTGASQSVYPLYDANGNRVGGWSLR